MDDVAADIVKRWERGYSDSTTFRSHWQDVANYMLPERRDYLTTLTPGMKRMSYIFDATPVWAVQEHAAGLAALLTTPPWFNLRTDDDALNANSEVASWLFDAGEAMYGIFGSPKHNFASQSDELYLDLATIGTSVMAELESAKSGILFSTRNMNECVIAENDEDRVDTVFRKWKYTAKQATDAWGERAGAAAVKAMASTPDRVFNYLHSVRPRRKRDPQRAEAKHMAWESIYVSEADRTVIGESGFGEFPYFAPRASKVTSEIYGRGRGMTALPDVKMLNEMVKTVIKGAQKVVDPALQVPDDGFLVPIRTVPGSLNFYRSGSRDRIEPIETKGQIQLGIEMINALRQQILRIFDVSLSPMPADQSDPIGNAKGVAATFFLQQRDEKLRLRGPMLARMQAELLGPLIDRTFAIMWRKSVALRFGPGSPFRRPPQALSGVPLRVEYVSPVAIAQRTVQLDNIGRLVQLALTLAQADPEAAAILDSDAIMRIGQRNLNVPAATLKTEATLQAQRQAKADAEAQMNAHAQLASVAGAAKDGSAALKNVATLPGNASAAMATQPMAQAA